MIPSTPYSRSRCVLNALAFVLLVLVVRFVFWVALPLWLG